MTGEREEQIGGDRLDVQLFALGEVVLPDGFDIRLKSFSEMMAAIDGMPAGEAHAACMAGWRSRQAGKAAEQDRPVDDFVTGYKRRHGKHPVVHRYGPGHWAILDETCGWLDQPWLPPPPGSL